MGSDGHGEGAVNWCLFAGWGRVSMIRVNLHLLSIVNEFVKKVPAQLGCGVGQGCSRILWAFIRLPVIGSPSRGVCGWKQTIIAEG